VIGAAWEQLGEELDRVAVHGAGKDAVRFEDAQEKGSSE
jgi:hypothetical protein